MGIPIIQVPIVGPATPGVMTPSFRAAGTPFQGFATDMSIAGAGVTVRNRQGMQTFWHIKNKTFFATHNIPLKKERFLVS